MTITVRGGNITVIPRDLSTQLRAPTQDPGVGDKPTRGVDALGGAVRNVSNWSQDVLGLDPDDPLYSEIAKVLGQLHLLYGFDIADPMVQERARATATAAARRKQEGWDEWRAEQAAKNTQFVVYYLRVGHLVKIGTTGDLVSRLRSYPPGTAVLATEPGSYPEEKRRLRQFAADRSDRAEWFRPSAALIEHINSLRDEPLTVADLAA